MHHSFEIVASCESVSAFSSCFLTSESFNCFESFFIWVCSFHKLTVHLLLDRRDRADSVAEGVVAWNRVADPVYVLQLRLGRNEREKKSEDDWAVHFFELFEIAFEAFWDCLMKIKERDALLYYFVSYDGAVKICWLIDWLIFILWVLYRTRFKQISVLSVN